MMHCTQQLTKTFGSCIILIIATANVALKLLCEQKVHL